MIKFAALVLLLSSARWTATAALAPSAPTTSTTTTKVEAAAISRFTKGYNKLCKTCPTLLQPKVSTLTEMILGLSPEDREELLETVALRLEQEEATDGANAAAAPTWTAEDVYKFQTGADAHEQIEEEKVQTLKGPSKINVVVTQQQKEDKVLGKMDKLRSKFDKNKHKVSQVQSLLEQTNQFLSKQQPQSQLSQIMDPDVLHATLELQQMSRPELKMQQLKYTAQKIKYEQKMAKTRVKLYGASLQLKTTVSQ